MAQTDREPQVWSCSAKGNVYYSTLNNPDWQNICVGMSSVSAGHSGVVCAIDNEGVINIRVGISDSTPCGLGWTSLLCEAKRVLVGSHKIVRITEKNKIFAAILPNVIDKNMYLSWNVVNAKDSISESNLLSLDVNDNLYIASKSGDVFVYVENQSAMEQSFWKLIITGPTIPQGLLSRLKSFASLGLLSDESNDNVDICSFIVGEKFMWLIRRNSKEIYQLTFDSTTEEPINPWNRFRLDSKWTINYVCGCKDSMIWAITNKSKLVTVTCSLKSTSVKECPIPLLASEDLSKFCWASVSIGYIRQSLSQSLQENTASPIKNTRVPPSSLSLYPRLSEESELTSNSSIQRSRECCDDGTCNFCMDQKQKTLDDSLSPVQISLQKKGYFPWSSNSSPGSKFGIKRSFSNNSDPIHNERIILKAKRRKIKSQLPKLKLLEGIKISLSQKLKKFNHYVMEYNPTTLQAATFTLNEDEMLFDFSLEEECLSAAEPVPMSIQCSEDEEVIVPMGIPCSEDEEVIVLSSSSVDNNTEAFEFNLPASMPHPPQASTVAMCTSMIPPTDAGFKILSSPIQATESEEHSLQPTDSLIQPLLLPMMSSPCVPPAQTPGGAVPLTAQSSISIPTAPPPPPIGFSLAHKYQQKTCVTESYSEVNEEEELEIKADSSSDEQAEEMHLT